HQVADLHEAALRGQLLHGITAVEQDSCAAIDVGDTAFARCGHSESRVEGENVVLAAQRSDVNDSWPHAPLSHAKLRPRVRRTSVELESLFGSNECGDTRSGCDSAHLMRLLWIRCAALDRTRAPGFSPYRIELHDPRGGDRLADEPHIERENAHDQRRHEPDQHA